MRKVFIYGTLRQGGRLHNLYMSPLDPKFLGTGFVEGVKLYDLGNDVPGIHPGAGCVKGELYEVTEDHYRRLLWLENGYVDTPVKVILEDKSEHEAVAFVWPSLDQGYGTDRKPTEVESGDWMKK